MAVALLQLRKKNYLHPRVLKELAAYWVALWSYHCSLLYSTFYTTHYNFLKHDSDNITTLLKNPSMIPHAYRKIYPFFSIVCKVLDNFVPAYLLRSVNLPFPSSTHNLPLSNFSPYPKQHILQISGVCTYVVLDVEWLLSSVSDNFLAIL